MSADLVISDVEQGSPEWRALRAGCITASNFKLARDRLKPTKAEPRGSMSQKAINYAATVAVERIAGRPLDRGFENWQMREGKVQEPEARMAYEVLTKRMVDELGFVTTEDGRFGYSPDGLIGDDGLLEIKTLVSGAVILDVIGHGDISEYRDQCLGGLWLTGRQWIDLVLWAPALASIGREMTVHRIERDDDEIQALEDDLFEFIRMVDGFERLLRRTPAEQPTVFAPAPQSDCAPTPAVPAPRAPAATAALAENPFA